MDEKWAIGYEHLLDDGIILEPGNLFRLEGEKGKRYRYIRTVTTDKGVTWIDCFGGPNQHQKSRSMDPDQIVIAEVFEVVELEGGRTQTRKKKRGKT